MCQPPNLKAEEEETTIAVVETRGSHLALLESKQTFSLCPVRGKGLSRVRTSVVSRIQLNHLVLCGVLSCHERSVGFSWFVSRFPVPLFLPPNVLSPLSKVLMNWILNGTTTRVASRVWGINFFHGARVVRDRSKILVGLWGYTCSAGRIVPFTQTNKQEKRFYLKALCVGALLWIVPGWRRQAPSCNNSPRCPHLPPRVQQPLATWDLLGSPLQIGLVPDSNPVHHHGGNYLCSRPSNETPSFGEC